VCRRLKGVYISPRKTKRNQKSLSERGIELDGEEIPPFMSTVSAISSALSYGPDNRTKPVGNRVSVTESRSSIGGWAKRLELRRSPWWRLTCRATSFIKLARKSIIHFITGTYTIKHGISMSHIRVTNKLESGKTPAVPLLY
jgi:hypothetical protein